MLCRLMTSKFPMVVVLAELAAQLKKRSLKLDLQWVPRDQNEEADALTNGDFSSFDPGRRINLKVADLKFEVLEDYMGAAAALYQEVLRRRSAVTGAAPRATTACPNPGVSAASDTPWAKAAATRTGAEAVGRAVGGLRQQAPKKRKLKEVAPW